MVLQIGAVTDGDNNSNFFLDDVAFDQEPVTLAAAGVGVPASSP